jgi:hypothetical protein
VASLEHAEALLSPAGPAPGNVVLISAERRWGLDALLERIATGLDGGLDAGGPVLPRVELPRPAAV